MTVAVKPIYRDGVPVVSETKRSCLSVDPEAPSITPYSKLISNSAIGCARHVVVVNFGRVVEREIHSSKLLVA